MLLKENMTVVLQGDSVTDAGRCADPEGLGQGYPRFVSKLLNTKYPDYSLTIYNKGISGNRSSDLVARWDSDCLELKPDIVTILIGVNDTWRNFDRSLYMPPEEYAANVEILIQRSQTAGAEVILLEPFIMPIGQPGSDWYNWNDDLGAKIVRLRELAVRYGTGYIPLMSDFASLCIKNAPTAFTADGVHPTLNGHRIIAQKIIDFLEK